MRLAPVLDPKRHLTVVLLTYRNDPEPYLYR